MRNKLGPRVPSIPRRGQTAVMGEINRSIEKMSLGEMSGGLKPSADVKRSNIGPLGAATSLMMASNRRDSAWTVSTEGYGSMRSNTSASRRCSELSQVIRIRSSYNKSLTLYVSDVRSLRQTWPPVPPGPWLQLPEVK